MRSNGGNDCRSAIFQSERIDAGPLAAIALLIDDGESIIKQLVAVSGACRWVFLFIEMYGCSLTELVQKNRMSRRLRSAATNTERCHPKIRRTFISNAGRPATTPHVAADHNARASLAKRKAKQHGLRTNLIRMQ